MTWQWKDTDSDQNCMEEYFERDAMLSLTLNSITETCCGMEDEMWNIFFLFVFM